MKAWPACAVVNARRTADFNRRAGAILMVVIVSIFVASMVAAALAQMAIAHHRQMRYEQNRFQAFWLAESGLQRAAVQLGHDAEYRGEDWQIDVPAGSASQPARVTIQVSVPETAPQNRVVKVQAEFPVGAVHRSTWQRAQTWSVPQSLAQREPSIPSAVTPENVVP